MSCVDMQEVLRDWFGEREHRCKKAIVQRGHRWICCRPAGHGGHCARMDLTLRYFKDGEPTAKTEVGTHLSQEEWERHLAAERKAS